MDKTAKAKVYLRSRDMLNTVWLDSMLSSLKTSGETEAITFVEGNYGILAELGLDITHAVLALFSKGNTDAAQVVLDSRMNPAQVGIQLDVVGEEASAEEAARQKFYADLEKVGMALLPIVAQLLLKAATGGVL